MGDFVAQVKGFTPVIDVVVEDVGLVAAAVYGAVWRFSQMQDGVCRASLETIAARVGVNRWTALRHIKALVQAGYLRDLTPDEKGRPHRYADTGKARLLGLVEAGRSDSGSTVGVAESQRGCDSESTVGVAESHPKRLSKRPAKKDPEDTHAGAAAPGARGHRGREDIDEQEVLDALSQTFCERTGLAPPGRSQVRELEARWRRPLRELAVVVEWDVGAGRELIRQAVQKLRSGDCVVADPRSILRTAVAMAGKVRAQRDPRRFGRGYLCDVCGARPCVCGAGRPVPRPARQSGAGQGGEAREEVAV